MKIVVMEIDFIINDIEKINQLFGNKYIFCRKQILMIIPEIHQKWRKFTSFITDRK